MLGGKSASGQSLADRLGELGVDELGDCVAFVVQDPVDAEVQIGAVEPEELPQKLLESAQR